MTPVIQRQWRFSFSKSRMFWYITHCTCICTFRLHCITMHTSNILSARVESGLQMRVFASFNANTAFSNRISCQYSIFVACALNQKSTPKVSVDCFKLSLIRFREVYVLKKSIKSYFTVTWLTYTAETNSRFPERSLLTANSLLYFQITHTD